MRHLTAFWDEKLLAEALSELRKHFAAMTPELEETLSGLAPKTTRYLQTEEWRAEGTIAAKGRIYCKGVIDGQFASLQLYLANAAGWVIKPDVNVVTNVIQNVQPALRPEQRKTHLIELQKAVWAECESDPQPQLPPPRRCGGAENDKKCVGEQERSHP